MSIAASDTALVQAATWGENLVGGSVATVAATLAVAGLGYALMTGRLELRRAARIMFGCFLLFSAQALVREVSGGENDPAIPPTPDRAELNNPSTLAPVAPSASDPYAGAALQM